MGAPAQTYFCENGHIVEDVPHHYMVDDALIEKCSQCGSTNIKCVLEWHDSDYWEHGDIDALVPHQPIRVDKKTIEVDILTFDVSKLFKKARRGKNEKN